MTSSLGCEPATIPPITSNAESQFKTWNDVVEYAKANPGKVTYATTGPGGSLHIGVEQLEDAAIGGGAARQAGETGHAREQPRAFEEERVVRLPSR